ncbi:hypothetical protein DFQ01_11787 [Paenibacillus cellulosilyticus]|uniref:Uncharacterized protein n=1 Tax=Paenibacillus cellulosilyticus TaxID=375489 RepID=A0A2V2YSL5_9BACL|nr:hypothetical protein DFQ01_11787 [Paenibacillus cellulosilyticus]
MGNDLVVDVSYTSNSWMNSLFILHMIHMKKYNVDGVYDIVSNNTSDLCNDRNGYPDCKFTQPYVYNSNKPAQNSNYSNRARHIIDGESNLLRSKQHKKICLQAQSVLEQYMNR